MHRDFDTADPNAIARLAGLSYLVIILAGVSSEVLLRAPLTVPGDPDATAQSILAALPQFRLSIAADAVMAIADVALAALLFVLLRPVSATVSLMAMLFRLVQAAILGLNLVHLQEVTVALNLGVDPAAALLPLEMHAHGYDLGLIFFGVNSLLTGWLIVRSDFLPSMIGFLLAGAGVVYLAGSAARILAPELVSTLEVAYLLPLVAESAMALWLVSRGVNAAAWSRAAAA